MRLTSVARTQLENAQLPRLVTDSGTVILLRYEHEVNAHVPIDCTCVWDRSALVSLLHSLNESSPIVCNDVGNLISVSPD